MNKTFYQIFYFQVIGASRFKCSNSCVFFLTESFKWRLAKNKKFTCVNTFFLCVDVDFSRFVLLFLHTQIVSERSASTSFRKEIYVSKPLINHHCQYLIIILLSAVLEIQFVFFTKNDVSLSWCQLTKENWFFYFVDRLIYFNLA